MTRIAGGTALALCVMAAPVHAEVTPQQVWDDLTRSIEDFGYSVDARQSGSGDTLTVSDVVVTFDMDDEGTMRVSMDEITLTGRDDGTVSVEFPETMPIDLSFEDGDDRFTLDYGQQGLSMIVSGTPNVMVYEYTAEQLSVTLAELFSDGERIGRDKASFSMTAGPVDGESTVTRGDALTTTAQSVDLGAVRFDGAFDDPEEEASGVFKGSLGTATIEGSSTIPGDVDLSDMAAAVAAGFGGSAQLNYSDAQADFTFTDDGAESTGQFGVDAGGYTAEMSGDALRYAMSTTGLRAAVNGPNMPLPIAFSLAEAMFSVALPTQPSEEPQDAGLALRLGGLSVSEVIWNAFDPAGQLPRTPATLALDIAAQVTPNVSLYDAEAMEALDEQPPGELNSVTLNDFTLEAGGGRATGTGAFTFDNDDLETFDGMPRPQGAAEFNISGVDGLIKNLIAMGLISEEDAMGARMMLSMFTVPGSDPDSVTTRIEINEQGHILANGQRIQ